MKNMRMEGREREKKIRKTMRMKKEGKMKISDGIWRAAAAAESL